MNFDNLTKQDVSTSTVTDSSTPTGLEVVTPEKTKAIVLQKASANQAEIVALSDKLDIMNSESLVSFGKEVAEEISKCSDAILNSVDMEKIEGSGELMKTLTNIMDKFDVKELSEEKQGFFAKLFGDAKSQLDKLLSKYNTMGSEVEKIYIELRKYEEEIKESNKKLGTMYETNMAFYQDLTKYILAGELGCQQIEEYRKKIEDQYIQTNDPALQVQLQTLDMGKQMLEQRVQDLRIAENVALQTIPMIKAMEFSNLNLARKINSAFIITLPVFKQNLARAVLLKRQKIQADAMSTLDEKTNEMLLRNAENTMAQTKLTAQLASGSSIKMETLEASWRTIMQGIDETRKIQEEASRKRIEDAAKLEGIKAEFNTKFLKG